MRIEDIERNRIEQIKQTEKQNALNELYSNLGQDAQFIHPGDKEQREEKEGISQDSDQKAIPESK